MVALRSLAAAPASDVGGGETRVLSSGFPKRGWWRRRRECERNEGISLAVAE